MEHGQHDAVDPGSTGSPTTLIRSRIANACDGCKTRKVRCDGGQPCSYCVRRQRPHACHYSAPRRAQQQRQGRRPRGAAQGLRVQDGEDPEPRRPRPAAAGRSTRNNKTSSPPTGDAPTRSSPVMESAEDDTEVPREARLLFDAQGKLIFIGDCAPLSFFQSVRQLVTSRVGQTAFAPESSRYSVLENAPGPAAAGALPSSSSRQQQQQQHEASSSSSPPAVRLADVAPAVESYAAVTAGLVDLFDEFKLVDDLHLWANLQHRPRNLTSAINYLVLAIGGQRQDEALSQAYFEYARQQALSSLGENLSVGTVQAFILVTIYMLCSCQINSAFLVFGLAARAAYSIGIHRTEVNARFGPEIHRQRDRLWKSLRVVDLLLSTSMGRPSATSDVDCTVPYRSAREDGGGGGGGGDNAPGEDFDLLNASVQILLVTESVVLEIYSRKRVSLQLTEGISRQLRGWSATWLSRLREIVAIPSDHSRAQVTGACQVLSSYYNAVMLVSRPFLMYELFRRLGDAVPSPPPAMTASGKSKLADACIDAATLMVEPTLDLVEQGFLDGRMLILVPWLFSASLVLGLGLLGGFGRVLERYARMSIQVLEHFALSDAHARQYSLIAQSLLSTAVDHLERREMQDRLRRTESSSQLFGLVPHAGSPRAGGGVSSPAARQLYYAASRAGSTGNNSPAAAATPGAPRRGRLSERHVRLDASGGGGGGLLAHVSSPLREAADSPTLFGLGGDDSLGAHDESFWNSMYQGTDGDAGAGFNLFPLLDAGGGIDLTNYLQ